MSKYIIYTYQFSPIRNQVHSLFDESNVDPNKSVKNKQVIFENILTNPDLRFSYNDNVYEHMILHNENHIIVLKLANNKSINIEEKFHKHKQPHYPSCTIIIDNRYDVQHIAIEDISSTFSNPDVVSKIIYSTMKRYLKKYMLHFELNRDFQKNEFWDTIKKHPEGITMVRFHFSYPNLPGVTKSIDEMISKASKATNSKATAFEFKSDQDENLEIDPNNKMLNGLVEASANSGNQITIKARGLKSHIKTGETTKSIEIDNLEVMLSTDMFSNASQKIIEIFNRIK